MASTQKNSCQPMANSIDKDRIAETFVGKKVLITGGTGFVGKVLVERILRVCPDVGKLILIVRPKKGKEPNQRIKEMFQGPLFESLRESRSLDELLTKVMAVSGDVKEKDLGLNENDVKICYTAHIIVHSAATVRFDEGIKRAVFLNTRGTKSMLELARQCPELELFIHVSTAYCHPEENVLEETLYPAPNDPNEVISILECLDDAAVDIVAPKLLGKFPNTYAYSKSLAEGLVEQAMGDIPVAILRPSVVIPILDGPIKGWTDNINGPTGLLIGAGKGIIRTMYGNDTGFADFIPVDCVASVIMALAWDYLKNGCHYKVLNLTTSEEVRVTWKEMIDIGRQVVLSTTPFDNVMWYPGGSMTTYRWWHNLRFFLFHWIPALLVDTILWCTGHKPLLMRIQTRIRKSYEVFEYYTSNQWTFRSDGLRAMRAKLNDVEKTRYRMDSEGINILEYFEHGVIAARRYVLKEPDENLPSARRRVAILRVVHYAVQVLFFGYLFYWLWNKIDLANILL